MAATTRSASGPRATLLVRNIGELVTCQGDAPRRGSGQREVGSVRDGAVAAAGGRVLAAGAERDVLEAIALETGARVIDAGGRLVTPGFVDAHTHPIFAGFREDEFNRLLEGETYAEIALRGGGIRKTVRATRQASLEQLVELGRARLDTMLLHGTTTAEAKSGYGLTLEHELRSLEAIRALDATHPVDLVPTLLAAHTVPAELFDRRAEYVERMVEEIVPGAAPLARFCDAFCDPTAFTTEEARRVLEAGLQRGLRPRLHADEFDSCGGAELAAELGAASADHLGGVTTSGIEALARAGVTAVLLPGTLFFLGRAAYAPARALIERGVPVALGTDLNPGTSYTESMTMVLQLACLMMRMTVEEAIVAATVNAAHSLGLGSEVGSLAPGRKADLVLFDAPNRFHLVYHYGVNRVDTVVKEGRVVVEGGRLVTGS